MRRPLLLLLPLLAGCIDFVAVQAPAAPELAEEARVQVALTIRAAEPGSGAPDSLEIFGTAYAGRDSTGRPRALADPRLRVGGRTVRDTVVAQDGRTFRVYDEVLRDARASLVDGRIALELPQVAGLPPASLVFPVAQRVGSDTVRVAEGERLVLRVRRPAPAMEPYPHQEFWGLELVAPGGRYVTLSGTDVLPDSLVVPGEWLPRNPSGTGPAEVVDVILRVRTDLWSEAGAVVGVGVSLHSEIRWQVRAHPAAP